MGNNKRKTPLRQRSVRTLADSIRQFLTPHVWKQAHRARRRGRTPRSSRWQAEPLILVLLLFTWCAGDSVSERFEAARGFYVVSHARRRRPGKTVDGFHKALAGLPMAVLRVMAAAVRRQLQRLFASGWQVDGWTPFGVDGSRLECPRTAELEQRIGAATSAKTAPMLWVTALVHLRLGLLWAWRLGKGRASERQHALQMLATLPKGALLVADAGFNGYGLAAAILQHELSFLIRMSSKVTLLVKQLPSPRANDTIVLYWPEGNRQAGQPPLKVRLLRLRSKKKGCDVWLLTNVLDRKRLPRDLAGKFYRWRWENEGFFRTFKRTLKKVKLSCRTVRLVHREAEGALLATQLLLAQGVLAVNRPCRRVAEQPTKCSPRKVLVEIRREIKDCRKPKRRRCFIDRLRGACLEKRERSSAKAKRQWSRRAEHKPPKPPNIRELNTTEQRVLARQKRWDTMPNAPARANFNSFIKSEL